MTSPWPWGSSPVKLITSTCHHVYMGWARTDLLEVLAIGSNTMSPLSSHQFMIFAKVHKIYIMTSYLILQNQRIPRIFFAWHDFAFDSPYPKMVKNVVKTKWAEFLLWVTFSERYLRFPLVYRWYRSNSPQPPNKRQKLRDFHTKSHHSQSLLFCEKHLVMREESRQPCLFWSSEHDKLPWLVPDL